MSNKAGHHIIKTIKIVILTLLILVIAMPAIVYIPFVQDFAKGIALREVKKSTGLDISIDFLRLRFPLKVELDGVEVLTAESDTLASLGKALVAVKVMPLLHGSIEASGLDVEDAYYRMGTPDSVMFLTANIDRFSVNSGDFNLKKQQLDIDKALLDGARINLVLKDTITPEKPDTAAPSPLVIHAADITLKNVEYCMQMRPIIDSLSAEIPLARLIDGTVDLGHHTVHAVELAVDSVSASYLTPKEVTERRETADSTATESEPWTVTADRLRLTARTLTYATAGAIPAPGFDFNYINFNDVALDIDTFYNCAMAVRVPIAKLRGTERCGLTLDAHGLFAMDSTMMQASDFDISLGRSHLHANAKMGLGDLTLSPSTPLMLKSSAEINIADIERAFPAMAKTLRGLPRNDILLNVDIDGTTTLLNVNNLRLDWPGYTDILASGSVMNVTDSDRLGGRVKIDGNLRNINFIKPSLLDAALSRQINIPPMKLKGAVDFSPATVSGNLALLTGSGRMALDGHWQARSEGYDGSLAVTDFPVQSFLPSLGIDDLTATVKVNGHGYNPLSPKTSIDASIDLAKVSYLGKQYSDIWVNATLADGKAEGAIFSGNPGADLEANFSAILSNDEYQWDVNGKIHDLDLMLLGLSTTPMNGSLGLMTSGKFYPKTMNVDARLDVTNLDWQMDDLPITAPQLSASVNATDSITDLRLNSGDMHFDAYILTGLDSLSRQISALGPFLSSQIEQKSLDVRALQAHIPPMEAAISLGTSNLIARALAAKDIGFSKASLTFHNDSLLSLQAAVNGFISGNFRLDDINFDANQHGKFLVYKASVDNRPGTLDDFAKVALNGYLADDKASILINQHNLAGKQGFYLGFNAAFSDSLVNVRMVPFAPMIAYQKWKLNSDNFISYNFAEKHIDANLELTNGTSLVHLFTNHQEAADSTLTDAKPESLNIALSKIHLQDWLSISPFAPPIKGDLGANLSIRQVDGMLLGKGFVNLTDLYYGRDRVGTFDLDLDVSNDRSGALRADVALLVDSVKVMTANGALNDSTASNPFLLDFSMIHFPLRVVNPFLPKNIAQMSGMLNGRMKISGDMAHPVFNGYLDFDSTAVKVGMTGVSYPFSEEKIPVDSNIVKFNDFTIGGLNRNDLKVNGIVDVRNLTNVGIDLTLNARNMQIVNSSRPRGADIYGKAFIDVDASARGNLRFLNVNAALSILPETNVTYILTSSQSVIASQSTDDMVKFVQFNDTTSLLSDTIQQSSMLLNLDAHLTIEEGSTINVDLSTDGKNKASIQGFGTLDYTLNPMNDGRLVGRFNINSGFVRYTPEVMNLSLMSEKNFKFNEGSYVSFTGDMMNPTLNIHAVDEMKANVTQEGQNSRLVNFLVGLSVTNTLRNMNVSFNLSTNDDITISNELASMSAEQRANQAMNLLLYNVYTGPGTKGNANISGNPLFTFLESQLNTWAANNIRGVDISFGIDQYDTTTDGQSQTTTSYSYRVSKTLFNDRFKIVVGGNYSTDANTDENFSQNLINDISFEYMLNRSGSMYVKLFRHVGYESILEGEITQTGVGFVYRHKINSLLDLFHWRRHKTVKTPSTVESK